MLLSSTSSSLCLFFLWDGERFFVLAIKLLDGHVYANDVFGCE